MAGRSAKHALRIRPFNRQRSLEALEGQKWGPPNFGSHVVTRCHALRRVPVGDLSTEDLRLLVAQKIGLRFVVPLALERLAADPLARGDFYPGDLLQAVLRLPAELWAANPDERAQVAAILDAIEVPSELDEAARAFVSRG